jgi:tryptophan halogenase
LLKPRKVLVVGGGIAGWMTATHLHAALNRDGRRFCEVGLVETRGGTSGTAEATLPEINRYLSILGTDQRRFMQEVGGTFSQGTRFVDWLDGQGEHYDHPFSMERPGSVDRAAERWLRSNRSIPFAATVSVQPALYDGNLAPLMLGRWDFGPPLAYGFHVDATRLRDFLKSLGSSGAIACYEDPAVDVELAEDGNIGSVSTAGGRRIEADLYIDCSGAAGMLVEALGVDWVDRSQTLLCDRVLSMSVPYERYYPGHVRPYTTATALSSGWLQDIPLQQRRSLRYFFSSAFQDAEAAASELRAVEGDHAATCDVAAASQRTGHRAQAWFGNCIAIGASASAIEPLESTTLYLVDHAAAMLAEHFPLGDELAPLAFRYNRIVANRFYEILDFVNLHYCLTRREDTAYWREARQPDRMTDRLKAKLEFWRRKPPTPADFEDQYLPGQALDALPRGPASGDWRSPVDTAGLWDHENYEAVLYGMDFLREECDAWFGTGRPDPEIPGHIASRLAQAPHKLPPHAIWLQRVVGMPAYPPR